MPSTEPGTTEHTGPCESMVLALSAAVLGSYLAFVLAAGAWIDLHEGLSRDALIAAAGALSPAIVTVLCVARSRQLGLGGHDRIRYVAIGVLTFSLIAGAVVSAAAAGI